MTGPSYDYQARILKVVDGDTCDVIVDLGFRIFMEQRLRLFGVNAPEMSSADHRGIAARDWLSAELPLGSSVTIRTAKPRDKYGRWLATVFVNEANINERLLASGLAEPYMTR